jgi:type I restriction enzyme R subunit
VIPFMTESVLEALVLEFLEEEGWALAHGPDIAPNELASERSDYRDVVLVGRLRAAIERLNPSLPSDAVDEAVNTVLRAESQVVMTENWRAYQLLTQGVPVQYRDADGANREVRTHLIDWLNPADNDFVAVNQFTIIGRSDRRPDVLLFVNGLPLVLMELKKPGQENASLRGAFNQVRTYLSHIPDAFTWNQITVISDGVQARAGTFTAGWEHYAPWKTIDGSRVVEGEISQAEVLVRGIKSLVFQRKRRKQGLHSQRSQSA